MSDMLDPNFERENLIGHKYKKIGGRLWFISALGLVVFILAALIGFWHFMNSDTQKKK